MNVQPLSFLVGNINGRAEVLLANVRFGNPVSKNTGVIHAEFGVRNAEFRSKKSHE
jgi:hypothetical protein